MYLNAKLKKTNDEIIEIKITNSQLKHFNDLKSVHQNFNF